jgi:hypothetical protein
MELFKRIGVAAKVIFGKPFILIEVGSTLKLTSNVSEEVKVSALEATLGNRKPVPKVGTRISLHELQEMLGDTSIQKVSESNTMKNTYSIGLKRLTLIPVDNVVLSSNMGHRLLKNILVNIVG